MSTGSRAGLVCALLLALAVNGRADAPITVDWCTLPKINGLNQNTITVGCNTELTFKWSCGAEIRHSLIEVVGAKTPSGSICYTEPLPDTSDSVYSGECCGFSKTITLNKSGTRHWMCDYAPDHCPTGMHFTVITDCSGALGAAAASVAPTPSPKPTPKPTPATKKSTKKKTKKKGSGRRL